MLFLLILFVFSELVPTISSTLVVGRPCQGNGYIGESTNCQVYGQCTNETISRLLRCPIGLYFDSAKQLCTVNLPPNCPIDQLEDNEIELKTILTVNGTNELLSDSSSPLANGYKVICYFTNWAWTSSGYGSLYPEDIPPHLCTHINYAFAVLDNQTHTLISSNGTIDYNMNFYRRVTDLKQINPAVKVLLSLGGWGDSADGLKYSQMVNNSTLRANFIKSVIPFLQSHGFDGIDFDWEYPTCWQNVCNYSQGLHDKQGFASLISELRSATNGSDFLITAAVGGWVNLVNTSYDISSLAQSLDFVNLMTYDLYYDYYHVSVHHSQLFSITNSTSEEENSRNCNSVVNKWINEGFPANKLILGVPFYGRSFTLADNVTINSTNYGLNHKSIGPGLPGPVTKEPGYISFTEICRLVRDSGWTVGRFNGTEAPVAFKDNQWVGFDDLLSLKRKADYIKQNGLGGAMLWELSLDDFQSTCCSHTWPLLKTLNAELNGYPMDYNINCYL